MSFSLLIVEDDPVARRYIVRALQTSGIVVREIFEAESGAEGLAVLSEHNIDFVLADFHMPGMSGEDMVKEMRAKQGLEKIPVVFISAETEEKIVKNIEQKGDGFIQKPFDPATLGQLVMDLISK